MHKDLRACIQAAIAGGMAISSHRLSRAKAKGDAYVGNHAIVTDADYISHAAIIKKLAGLDAESLFITEEHVKDESFKERFIRSSDMGKLLASRVFIIDELDGSSSFSIGHYEWSVSVGCVENLSHIA